MKGKGKMFGKVDAFIGSGNIDKIAHVIDKLAKSSAVLDTCPLPPVPGSCLFPWNTPRIKATPGHYAYMKIADGCDNRCSYCAVPRIRGPFRSRKVNDIVREARLLARAGVKELILVAQDTTYYGVDLYGEPKLHLLLKKLCSIRGLRWIRIMYAHPAHVTDKLIKVISSHKKICRYLDLPLQHVCDSILKRMGRRVTTRKIIDLIAKIRRVVPGIALRTSFIVGFPGETKEDFRKLLDFIQKERFERLGVFRYSAESGTRAKKMRGAVSERSKASRFHRAMNLQAKISKDINKGRIGKMLEVLVEKSVGNGSYVGRTEFDAPEIDGSVLISLPKGRKKDIRPGEIVPATVTGAGRYDLFATLTP